MDKDIKQEIIEKYATHPATLVRLKFRLLFLHKELIT